MKDSGEQTRRLQRQVNGAGANRDLGPAGAKYGITNTSSTSPAAGFMHIPPSGLTLYLNAVDKDGVNHTGDIAALQVGQVVKIYTLANVLVSQFTLTSTPINILDRFNLLVAALPVAADGNYLLRIDIPAPTPSGFSAGFSNGFGA